jgi:hypothetical protein
MVFPREVGDRLRGKYHQGNGMWKSIEGGHSVVTKGRVMSTTLCGSEIEHCERETSTQDKAGDMPGRYAES